MAVPRHVPRGLGRVSRRSRGGALLRGRYGTLAREPAGLLPKAAVSYLRGRGAPVCGLGVRAWVAPSRPRFVGGDARLDVEHGVERGIDGIHGVEAHHALLLFVDLVIVVIVQSILIGAFLAGFFRDDGILPFLARLVGFDVRGGLRHRCRIPLIVEFLGSKCGRIRRTLRVRTYRRPGRGLVRGDWCHGPLYARCGGPGLLLSFGPMLVRRTACLLVFLTGPMIGGKTRIRSRSAGGCLGLCFGRVRGPCRNRILR
mmetsp:Transcript_36010/g.86899  ORF Transcript_36010/g.86899 Transcript_36010/m.86899 type:complete len:257 (+) Transcript_36010:1474-2244(+)